MRRWVDDIGNFDCNWVERADDKRTGETEGRPLLSRRPNRNKDGILTVKDLHLARKEICEMNNWVVGSVEYDSTKSMFDGIWTALRDQADDDSDEKITAEEWMAMWQKFHEAVQANREDKFPGWVKAYLLYRFQLLDRDRNGIIDEDEFSYVMGKLGIPEKSSKACFMMFTQNKTRVVDYDNFRRLAAQYYRSDDPCALGNFITGKLDWFN
ncbi:Calexcitin-2 [Nymphon striatum]|nr:Calexcitin-2 [Nymphon striatum]